MTELIDPDVLFQELLEGLNIPEAKVAADIDADSFNDIPMVIHNAVIAADRNGPNLWSCTLTVTVHVDANDPTHFDTVKAVYAGIWSWDLPRNGIVPGVGAVERVERDLSAFTRLARGVPMLTKSVTPYVGSFELSIRNL